MFGTAFHSICMLVWLRLLHSVHAFVNVLALFCAADLMHFFVVVGAALQFYYFPTAQTGDSILGSLKAGGASLKKVDPPPEPKIDERTHLLRSIQLGSVQLKSAAAGAGAKAKQFQKIDVKVMGVVFIVFRCFYSVKDLFLQDNAVTV